MTDLRWGDRLDLMTYMPDGSVDMILCDPPFGVTRSGWDKPIDAGELLGQYARVIKDNGAIVLFGAGAFTAQLILAAGNLYRYSLVWVKTQPTGFLNAKRMPMRAHEDIIVCYKHLPAYHPQMRHGLVRKVSTAEHKRNSRETDVYGKYKKYSYDSTDRYPTSVLTFKSDKQKCALVPTQKPVALLEYLIRTYTDEGETVLDSCMGSGSTGVACVKTGRSFIGIELDYEVFSKAKTRIDEDENEQRKGAVSDA